MMVKYLNNQPTLKRRETMKACKKGGKVEEHDMEGEDEPLKKGGAAKKKATHHAHGGMAKHRADKRARGGKVVTPKSPLSGAAPTKERPGFSEKFAEGKEDN
jgi:hypothetical protein